MEGGRSGEGGGRGAAAAKTRRGGSAGTDAGVESGTGAGTEVGTGTGAGAGAGTERGIAAGTSGRAHIARKALTYCASCSTKEGPRRMHTFRISSRRVVSSDERDVASGSIFIIVAYEKGLRLFQILMGWLFDGLVGWLVDWLEGGKERSYSITSSSTERVCVRRVWQRLGVSTGYSK